MDRKTIERLVDNLPVSDVAKLVSVLRDKIGEEKPTYREKLGEMEVELNIDGDLEEGLENINELVEETTVKIEEMTEAMQEFGDLLNGNKSS